jgi:hypothetical protein
MFNTITGFKRAWTKWLLSGAYEQGKGALCRPGDGPKEPDKFCCLGVAANVLIESGHKIEWTQASIENLAIRTKRSNASESTGWLLSANAAPTWLRAWLVKSAGEGYGGRSREQALAYLNDQGKTFEEIAAIIKSWK